MSNIAKPNPGGLLALVKGFLFETDLPAGDERIETARRSFDEAYRAVAEKLTQDRALIERMQR